MTDILIFLIILLLPLLTGYVSIIGQFVFHFFLYFTVGNTPFAKTSTFSSIFYVFIIFSVILFALLEGLLFIRIANYLLIHYEVKEPFIGFILFIFDFAYLLIILKTIRTKRIFADNPMYFDGWRKTKLIYKQVVSINYPTVPRIPKIRYFFLQIATVLGYIMYIYNI